MRPAVVAGGVAALPGSPVARARIRVLLADDHPLMRLGLRGVIEAQPDMEVAAEAVNGVEAVRLFEIHRPDVTLMDLRMPVLEGPEAIAAIVRRHPRAAIVVLTSYDGDEDVYRAVQAGARGFLLKDTAAERILAAIGAVHAGGRLFSPGIAAKIEARTPARALNGRERAILELVAKGLTNREIQAALAVREGTLKRRLKHIFEKLDVEDRTEATLAAVHQGIIRLPR
jgi:two-component system NarL family response regulator